MRKLKARLIIGFIFIITVIAVFYLDKQLKLPALTMGMVVFLIVFAQWEFIALCRGCGFLFWPKTAFYVGCGFALTRTRFVELVLENISPAVSCALGVVTLHGLDIVIAFSFIMIASLGTNHERRDGAQKAMSTFLVALVLPFTLGFMDSIRTNQMGLLVLTMLVTSAKLGDVSAYFIGSLFGRHKMAPKTSPNKSWEGAAASLAASICVAVLFGWFYALNIAWSMAFGIVVGVTGQISDLVESRMKRDADVKDSGSLIPAFGGVLDTVDSLILAAPAAFVMQLLGVNLGILG